LKSLKILDCGKNNFNIFTDGGDRRQPQVRDAEVVKLIYNSGCKNRDHTSPTRGLIPVFICTRVDRPMTIGKDVKALRAISLPMVIFVTSRLKTLYRLLIH